MSARRPTASLYLRISIATDESDSLERQERDLRRLAADEGLDVIDVRVDEGVSGAATERPAFREWLADAETGRADVLLAWRFDRISREGLSAVARILDVLRVSGARLLTFGDRVDSASPAFRMVAAVLSEGAYAERESIRARVASRQAADRRAGRWAKPRPYGYDVVDGRLVQRPDEADTIRDLVARFLSGASLRALAADPTAQGLPTPRAAKGYRRRDGATYDADAWGLTTVRAILTSPTLVGHYPHRVRPSGASGRAGELTIAARDDHGDIVTVTDAPILTLGVFAAVAARLESRSALGPDGRRRPAVGGRRLHPLSGLLRCGSCGGAIVYDRRRDGRAPIFRCQRRAHNPAACPGVSVRADDLEAAVIARVLAYVPALDVDSPEAEVLIARWLRANDPGDDAARRSAEAAYADAEAAVADLETARYERGEFPGHGGAERWGRLYERARFRLKVASDALAGLPEPSRNVGGLFDRVLLEESLAGSADARRDLYPLVLDRVYVDPGHGSNDLDGRVRPVWASATSRERPRGEVTTA